MVLTRPKPGPLHNEIKGSELKDIQGCMRIKVNVWRDEVGGREEEGGRRKDGGGWEEGGGREGGRM